MSKDPSPKLDSLRAMRERNAEKHAKKPKKAPVPKLTPAQIKAREKDALDDV